MALQLVDRGVRATIKSMDYEKLPAFDEDGAIHVVVECPRGTSVKLKFDTGLGAFSLSRPLPKGWSTRTIGALFLRQEPRTAIPWMPSSSGIVNRFRA